MLRGICTYVEGVNLSFQMVNVFGFTVGFFRLTTELMYADEVPRMPGSVHDFKVSRKPHFKSLIRKASFILVIKVEYFH